MKGLNLMDAFGDFKELKNIDRETMVSRSMFFNSLKSPNASIRFKPFIGFDF